MTALIQPTLQLLAIHRAVVVASGVKQTSVVAPKEQRSTATVVIERDKPATRRIVK
nr:MAG TPA: hypothetical protein [Caudoviricetes sp.]